MKPNSHLCFVLPEKMLGLRWLPPAASVSKPTSLSFIALYSTVAGLTRKNWGVTDPAPRSLLEAEEDENDKPILPKPSRSAVLRSKAADTPTPYQFKAHRQTLKAKFPEGWSPPRKLSREAMDGLRSLHAHNPDMFTTPVLAEKFKISPEAVRRILRSKWMPTREQLARLKARERESREKWILERRKEERERQKQW